MVMVSAWSCSDYCSFIAVTIGCLLLIDMKLETAECALNDFMFLAYCVLHSSVVGCVGIADSGCIHTRYW